RGHDGVALLAGALDVDDDGRKALTAVGVEAAGVDLPYAVPIPVILPGHHEVAGGTGRHPWLHLGTRAYGVDRAVVETIENREVLRTRTPVPENESAPHRTQVK